MLLYQLLVIAIASQLFCFGESAVAVFEARIGDEVVLDVPGKLLVKRITSAHQAPQYLWAGKCQNGWTTDGKNQIGSNAKLDWDTGKLTIKSFSAKDAGSYTFPLEESRPNLAPSMISVVVKEE